MEAEFQRLAATWHDETGCLSNPSQILGHPAYRQIIAMGEQALPWIFADLARRGGDWFGALKEITGDGPVIPPEHRGRWREIRAAWLAWGHEHGYVAQQTKQRGR